NRGKIVADGTAETLRAQAQGQQVLHARIEDGEPGEILQALQALPSVALVDFLDGAAGSGFLIESRPNQSSNRAVFQLCVQRKWTLCELIPFETRLEDIFRNLTMN
ncbi:MAG: hypothetical protein KDC43_16885, partial [Saprospiraceae bacterium]|nr:hypothetical protein [Saprospiraceae bacterium]MCB0625538.1 hypothetical protein [Saprospiraceae bacterium]MCB0680421.1 hypothetical protein [Saprospiraceae bacterium]